jgi:hypothetical protein
VTTRAPRHLLGFVDDAGRFAFDNVEAWGKAKAAFKGEEVLVTIKKKPRFQGTQSMRYYRGVVIPDIAEACGYDPDDEGECEQVHESMAWKFLRISDHPELGYPRRRSTAKDDMSQDEITAYIDKVIEYAEREIVDCRVRRPHEVDMDKVYAPEAA